MNDFIYRHQSKFPIKMWTNGIEVEQSALAQLDNIANMPFIHKHVAVMPDCHSGIGATIGSVIATSGAIIPAAVGVDLGCGMEAVLTTLTANDLPDDLFPLRSLLESKIPHGRSDNGQSNDKGSWNEVPTIATDIYKRHLRDGLNTILAKHPKVLNKNNIRQLGTLGTGNHFIEICLDESDRVWVMLHSGSRGQGNTIGSYFIEKAKDEMRKYFIYDNLEDKDLAYLVEHTQIFNDYVEAVTWAQGYAFCNRQIMMEIVLENLYGFLGLDLPTVDSFSKVISCHHNYISKENHFGKNVIVTRKGAIQARSDTYGIIPGSMGTGSFIVKGKGNKESFCSCSHGAGRKMSRNEARRTISLEDHAKAMKGIEGRLDSDVIDESPAAYKDINLVMKAQDSLVEVVHSLHQILNIKG